MKSFIKYLFWFFLMKIDLYRGCKQEIWISLKQSIPLIGISLADVASGIVDTFFMGKLSSSELAAGGLAVSFWNILFQGFVAILSIVSPLVSRAYGSKNALQNSRIANQLIWVVGVMTLTAFPFFWNSSSILRALGQDPNLTWEVQNYLKPMLIGLPAILSFIYLTELKVGLNKANFSSFIIFLSIPTNALLNLLLLKFGLAGIAWASVIVYWMMLFTIFFYSPNQVHVNGSFLSLPSFHQETFLTIFKLGLPQGCIAVMGVSLFFFMAIFMGWLGTPTLAAHHVVNQITLLTFRVPSGLSRAAAVRVAYYRGLESLAGIRLTAYIFLVIGVCFMLCMTPILWFAGFEIGSWFAENNFSVNLIVQHLLRVAAFFQVFDALQIILLGILRGLYETQFPLIATGIGYWGVGLVSAYVLGFIFHLGAVGIWSGLATGLAVTAGLLWIRFRELT
ncbi:hypothetical protein B4U84_28740 [Westiellopsis prolifica IICB1]|nr:hypothetical protein B4U84_28740 [Westiellopsis prolifica IICB1]